MVNTNHHSYFTNFSASPFKIGLTTWDLSNILTKLFEWMSQLCWWWWLRKVSSYKNLYCVHQLHFTLFNSFILIVNTLLTPKGQCTCMNDFQGLCLCLSFVSISSRQVGVRTTIRWSNYLRIRTIKRRWLIQNERGKNNNLLQMKLKAK